MTPNLHYTDPRLARLYDLGNGLRDDHAFYLSLAGPPPQRILDIGCGTGALCNNYAALGHIVTGVDPAPAMLDVARAKPQGADITWVNASAHTFHSTKRFDLIVMTGHAFQHLLDDADIAIALAVMRRHLAPGGTVAFETRNPAVDWANRWHGQSVTHVMDGQTIHQSYNVLAWHADRITFETRYKFPDVTLTSTSTLRFQTLADIRTMLRQGGLSCRSVFGDWASTPFDPTQSDEMIFLARRS